MTHRHIAPQWKQQNGWLMRPKVNLNAYFERIGFAGSIAPTLGTLDQLVQLHPASIPFENLDPLLGEPVLLDQASLERKLLADNRGGNAFEHNSLLLSMLGELDYTARPLLASVLWPSPQTEIDPDLHLIVLVELAGQTYLADAGFGAMTPTAPLKLRADVEQTTPHGDYRLLGGDPRWELQAKLGEGWVPLYSFDANAEGDIAASNQYVWSDPASSQRRTLTAALSPKGSRIVLTGNQLSLPGPEGEPEQRTLTDEAELREALMANFGITLPESELLDAKLLAILAGANPLTT
ncbi:arylamine N-acetyltransferase [Devosia sp. 1566]|uniref:arylamine N-acetyltransferase family protein n=1 Tax=Devosia sp. 1566 TaxID=2499144 RepID=UPI000FDAAF15|nr:arylamine N-acetyltransferase [Devosia sp. 1566]